MSDIVKGYTPGPWIAADYGDYGDYDGNCIVILGNNEQVRVAVVLGVNDAETKATARLIASAPDMADTIAHLTAEVERLTEQKIAFIGEIDRLRETQRTVLVEQGESVARLTAEVEKLKAALQWQPIETALRISRHEILVWDGEHRFVAWWKSGAFWRADGAMFDPTHWMHLSPPPALKENNSEHS
jgi:uncharacterized small protein (DUF1192 family)